MPDPENIAASSMSLRDYFAAKAMAAAMGWSLPPDEQMTPDEVAHDAYAIADAMLRARSNPLNPWPRLHTDFANDIR